MPVLLAGRVRAWRHCPRARDSRRGDSALSFDFTVSLAFTLLTAGVLVLLVLETVLAFKHKPLITQHVHAAIKAWPQAAFVVCFFVAFTVGALFGHFFWVVTK